MFTLMTGSATWRSIPVLVRWYLACQVLLPVIAWIVGSQRFTWAMYSHFQPSPQVFVQRHPGAPFEELDLVRTLGHLRGELDYSGMFVRQVCRQAGVNAVRLVPPQQAAADYQC